MLLILLLIVKIYAFDRNLISNAEVEQIINECKSINTIVSKPRLIETIHLSKNALLLEGDFVETGVYVGGTASLMMKVLNKYNKQNRVLHAYDSFEGLPSPTDDDKGSDLVGNKGMFSLSMDKFINNMKSVGAYNDKLKIYKGWFKDTIPLSNISKISFLRLDADLYESTKDALEMLYDKVVPGGYIYIDDYASFNGCRKAVDEFRYKNKIYETLHYVREENRKNIIVFEACWWVKRD